MPHRPDFTKEVMQAAQQGLNDQRTRCVDEDQRHYFVASFNELAHGLEADNTSHRSAADKVRPCWLMVFDLLDEMCCHSHHTTVILLRSLYIR